MKTESLLKALALAKPSLGSNDSVVPILSHFCFSEDTLYSFNDVSAIIVEEKTGLSCALHGDTLLGLLSVSGTDDIAIKANADGVVQLKGTSGWVKVPSLPLSESNFALPEEEPHLSIPITKGLLEALARTSISVATDSIKPEYAGVTIEVSKAGVVLYSTDNKTASRCVLLPGKLAVRKSASAVIPAQSCDQLSKLATACGLGGAKLALGSTTAIGTFEGATLVTRVLPAKLETFVKVFDHHEKDASTFLIPEGFAQEIAKANVILARETIRTCTLDFSKGKMKLSASGAQGTMESSISSAGKTEGSVKIDPTLIARILPFVQKVAVNDKHSLVLSSEGLTHIIASQVS